ncbi:MAG TPA: DUF349 domain-containing protein [Candidatus Limnocylindrales bacterium]|nr:DUF349 domain-containing protein [Candidatus Limnocylindrales bacterium]
MSSDWASYGRVDADGTVWVKTAAGERAVGSWQAGTPEEGLAHFVRRFEDLLTEVTLLETRLASGAADASQTLTTAKRLRGGLDEAHVVGDIDGLGVRLDAVIAVAQEKAAEARQAREAARAEAIARKTTLVEEAEKLAAESTSWKATGDRFKEILEEWKTIRGVDKKADGELWKRFSIARDSFTRRRGGHFASLDSQRKQAQQAKDQLVAEAEELATSTDWKATADRLKELMEAWKTAPRASKEAEQKLWERFRAAQDTFFSHRKQVFSERDAEQKHALTRRQELLARAEGLDIDADPKAAQAQMRDILGQWHDTGRVPRESVAPLDRRLRAVEDRIREAMDAAWRRTEPSANPLLTQMRDQVAEAEARLERARVAGDSKRIREAEDALNTKKRFLELAESSS